MQAGAGIYLAGADQHAGKTTISLGLLWYFQQRLPRGTGFLKPMGQKSLTREGVDVGEDSYLVNQVLKLNLNMDLSAPFITAGGVAEHFLETGEPADLAGRIRRAYWRMSRRRGLVVVEGSGHPGVGAVFQLSNGAVANLLQIPVLLVLNGGIGSTIDRFALCNSLLQLENAPLLGVVINKIEPGKMEKVRASLGAYFRKLGIPVFGYIPLHRPLLLPSLQMLGQEFRWAQAVPEIMMNGQLVENFICAAGTADEALARLARSPSSLLVLQASRLDVLEGLIARRMTGLLPAGPAGVVFCGGECPAWIGDACRRLQTPVWQTPDGVEAVLRRLQQKTFKAQAYESVKIEEMIKLVVHHMDLEALWNALHQEQAAGPPAEPPLLYRFFRGVFDIFRKN